MTPLRLARDIATGAPIDRASCVAALTRKGGGR